MTRCKIAGAVEILGESERTVSLHPSFKGLTLADAAAHLDITEDDFHFYRLFGRIPEPINGLWSIATLSLASRRAAGNHEPRSGLYVIEFMGFVKIGFSGHLLQRVATVQDTLPTRVKIHRIIDGPTRARERAIHRRFAKYRTRGEWFRREDSLAIWIEEGCPI